MKKRITSLALAFSFLWSFEGQANHSLYNYGTNGFGYYTADQARNFARIDAQLGREAGSFTILGNHGPDAAAFEALKNSGMMPSSRLLLQLSCGGHYYSADGFLTSKNFNGTVIGTKPGYFIKAGRSLGVYMRNPNGPHVLVDPSQGLGIFRNGELTKTILRHFHRLFGSEMKIQTPEGLIRGTRTYPAGSGMGGSPIPGALALGIPIAIAGLAVHQTFGEGAGNAFAITSSSIMGHMSSGWAGAAGAGVVAAGAIAGSYIGGHISHNFAANILGVTNQAELQNYEFGGRLAGGIAGTAVAAGGWTAMYGSGAVFGAGTLGTLSPLAATGVGALAAGTAAAGYVGGNALYNHTSVGRTVGNALVSIWSYPAEWAGILPEGTNRNRL